MSLAEDLLQLEEVDHRLAALEAERGAAGERQRGDPSLERLERRLHEAEEAERRSSSRLRQEELELAELSQRAEANERALYDGSVRHPADLERRQHQLATLRGEIEAREEAELVQLEDQDRLGAELEAARRAVQERQEELRVLVGADQERAASLSSELEAARAELAAVRGRLPAPALRLYQATAARRHPALARVTGGTCGGCRMPVPHRILEEVRQDRLVCCEHCERILLP